MSENQGFIDLRIGHGAGGIGDDSVWPSFTDVMTVIVMIFLMALVVIMVRNFQLDQELLFATTAKEETYLANQSLVERLSQLERALSESTGQKDDLKVKLDLETTRFAALLSAQQSLNAKLESLLGERSQLQQDKTLLEKRQVASQVEIAALTESSLALSLRVENLSAQLSNLKVQSSEQIASLGSDKKSLSEKLDTVSTQLAEVSLSLQQSQSQAQVSANEVRKLEAANLNIEQRYGIASKEILTLKQLIAQRKVENAALQAKSTTSLSQFKSLQEEYESLEEKFRSLVRPARSAAGKQVATVWIQKTAAGIEFKMAQPGELGPQDVAEQQMHANLQALKEKLGDTLYIRIVIPKDSGLLYEQASGLTRGILQKYDYYTNQ